tara:strand:- start:14 stop:751 length:738 start_codon:yes stop_codon:yes gene_type:complete
MKRKADLHNHLKTKAYYKSTINQVIDISRDRLGSGGILGLANCDDLRYEEFVDLKGYERENFGTHIYIPEKEITVVKGQEVFTKQGHILCIGLPKNKHVKSKNLEDALKEARDLGTITIVDHPFFYQGCGDYLNANPELLDFFDAIEVHNGEAFYGNKKAKEFYDELKNYYDIGAISSSDGHSLYEIGSSYSILNINNFNLQSLRNSIRAPRDVSLDKQHNSYLGTLDHSTKMIIAKALKKLRKN